MNEKRETVDWTQFRDLPLVSTGWERYGIHRTMRNVDGFVYKALKSFDKPYCFSLYGYTKTGEGEIGVFKDFRHFDRKYLEFRHLGSMKSAWRHAERVTRAKFFLGERERVEPVDYDVAMTYIHSSSSPGYRFLGQKKSDVLNHIYNRGLFELHMIKGPPDRSKFNKWPSLAPVMLGCRGHLSKRSDPKTRTIFVYPSERLFQENIYTVPLNRIFKDNDTPMMYGAGTMRNLSSMLYADYDDCTCFHLDWSKFDKCPSPFMLRTAFDILFQNIKFDDWQGNTVSYNNRRRWSRVREFLIHYFIYTPIVLPNGDIIRKQGGISSGSGFTQMIGSIINYLVINTILIHMGIKPQLVKVLGDDAFLVIPNSQLKCFKDNRQFVDDVHYYGRRLGFELNTSKTKIFHGNAKNKSFLGYTFRQSFLYRDTRDWFLAALYAERIVKDSFQSYSRLVGLMFIGASSDKRFTEFFEYFSSGYNVRARSKVDSKVKKKLLFTIGYDPFNVKAKVSMDFMFEMCFRISHFS